MPMSPLSGHSPSRLRPEDRSASKAYSDFGPLFSQKSAVEDGLLAHARTSSYVPTTPLGKQVAASADAIRKRLLQTPASEARHAASQLASAPSM